MVSNLKRVDLYSTTLSLLATLAFDFFISSGSVMPFRIIFNISFMMIIYITIYVSILLITNSELPIKTINLVLPSITAIIPLIMNFKTMAHILLTNTFDIGLLNNNILIQSVEALFYLQDYIITMFLNAVILYIIIHRTKIINYSEIFTYVLGVISIETFLSIYFFHLAGVLGIRIILFSFHLSLCIIIIWLYNKNKIHNIHIKLDTKDLILTLLSVGVFMMAYIPSGIYNQFGDNAVIVGSTISIIKRGSLIPYYITDNYYSPIGGFLSITFSFITGINNILLSSTLPFLIAHLMLPFVAFHFFREFVTEDSRIAIIGTVMTILMDGLGVILLPNFIGNLSRYAIEWKISPATKSLYFSSTSWLWLVPYKIMGMACATSICNILPRKRTWGLFVGGALLGLSFINPRQPFIALLILVFLFGIRKINLKEILTLLLISSIFLGPILPAILFKTSEMILNNLIQIGFKEEILNNIIKYFRSYVQNAFLSPAIIGILSIVLFLIRPIFNNMVDANNITKKYISKKTISYKSPKDLFGKTYSSLHDMTFIGFSIILFSYIVFYAYNYSPDLFLNTFINAINYIVLRYHIVILLILFGFFRLKYNRRILFTIITLMILIYLGKITESHIGLTAPLLIIVISLPTYKLYIKFQKRLILSIISCFVILGVFSAFYYSGIVTSPESNLEYTDLSPILSILLNENSEEPVFCASSYCYYPQRIVGMANMQLSNNPESALKIIDRFHTSNEKIEEVLHNNTIKLLYNGVRFLLYETIQLERTEN